MRIEDGDLLSAIFLCCKSARKLVAARSEHKQMVPDIFRLTLHVIDKGTK
jgi:hypothetical protein